MPPLEQLGFYLVGYGCTTCIGNSGPLEDADRRGDQERRLVVALACSPATATSRAASTRTCARTTSLRRRSSSRTRSPARMDIDLVQRAARHRQGRQAGVPEGRLADAEGDPRTSVVAALDDARCSRRATPTCSRAPSSGRRSTCRRATIFAWDEKSTYVRKAPFFDGLTKDAPSVADDIIGARVLAMVGDSITTDHISPAGNIAKTALRRKYLRGQRRRAARLQPVRRAPRQSRGDDARHVRQHPPQEPARARHRGRHHALPADATDAMSIYDAADEVPREQDAARRARRQGVRHRLVARLGGEGHAPARRARP